MDDQTRWAMRQMQRCLREGNAAAVVEIGEHVLARGDEDLETFRLAATCLALAYEKLGQWDRALHWFRQCLAMNPDDPTFLAGRGRVLSRMGKHAEAAAVFRQLAGNFPDRADYHAAAGSVLLRMADLSGALHHLQRARRLDPLNPYILNDLAGTHLLRGDLEAALGAFRQATEQIGRSDRELARDIHESIEEVRAALLLARSAAEPPPSARIADVYPVAEALPAVAASQVSEAARPEPDSADAPEAPSPKGVGPEHGVPFAESKVRAMVLETMIGHGCRSRQILAALHLWSDFMEALPAREFARAERKAPAWAAAVVYTVGRLDGATWAIQSAVAKCSGVSAATVSRLHNRLRRTLAIEDGDPRYSATAGYQQRAVPIEQAHRQ